MEREAKVISRRAGAVYTAHRSLFFNCSSSGAKRRENKREVGWGDFFQEGWRYSSGYRIRCRHCLYTAVGYLQCFLVPQQTRSERGGDHEYWSEKMLSSKKRYPYTTPVAGQALGEKKTTHIQHQLSPLFRVRVKWEMRSACKCTKRTTERHENANDTSSKRSTAHQQIVKLEPRMQTWNLSALLEASSNFVIELQYALENKW